MKRSALLSWFGAAAAAVFLLANSLFIVGQSTQALVVEFGRPVAVVNPPGSDDPGLKFKIPFLQSVVRFDRRDQSLEADPAEIASADRKAFLVGAVAGYRIVRPLAFYDTLHDGTLARRRISPIIDAAVRSALASATAADIVSGSLDRPMAAALGDVRAGTKNLGIEVTDLRLTHVGPTAADAPAVEAGMRSAFARQAAQIRADGQAKSREIMAEADKDSTVALAQANTRAFAIRGAGDAKAAAIYDASFGRDPSFAAFYRSLQAYEGIVDGGQTTLVVPADTAFLKYFRHGPSGR